MIIDIPEPPGVNIIDSRLKCLELGADLVTIRTREHQKFLMNKLFVNQVNISIVTFISTQLCDNCSYRRWPRWPRRYFSMAAPVGFDGRADRF